MPSDPAAPEPNNFPQGTAGVTDASSTSADNLLQVRASEILERVTDAFVLLDAQWRIVYANREACRINRKPQEEFVGRLHWEEWPAAVGTELERQFRRAMAEGVDVHFQHRYVAAPYDVWLEIDAYPTQHGLSLFYRDITARRQAEEALRRSREDLRLAVDAAHLGTFYCDYPLHKISWNATCAEHFFLPSDAEVDFALFYSLLHPDDREPTRRAIARAQAERVAYDVEYRTQAPDGRTRWVNAIGRFYYDVDGIPIRFDGITRDISQRKIAEEALRQSEERYRLLVEGARDYAMILMDRGGRITGWNAGAERILGWGESEVLGLPSDLIFTPEDRAAGVPAQELTRAASEGRALDLRWHLRKDGRRFYSDGIMQSVQDGDGRLCGFAKVLRDATERKVLEDERERLADANRLLLDSTGEGIYGIDLEGRFTFVNRAAGRMLGFAPEQMVGRDGHSLIHHTRPDGTPYPVDDCPIYQSIRDGRSVSVEDDVFRRRDGAPCPVAYSAAPIFEHGLVRGAVVTFSDVSARRTLEQERERVAERERNIAAHLQSALTPALPECVPGLALTKYYEAALEEAGVGGDFYDGFAVGTGRTALVVGDLAGKGLAAAAQVSTVRNMLRAFLYSQPTAAEAVTALNRVLAENTLLTGFATLFAGVYDSATGRLQYVNCGQEPALVRRADTGVVEPLDPTGPILGAIEGLRYPEVDVALVPGDAVAIFTDGLTEVGASHRDMLGIEGVAALLAEPVAGQTLQPAEQVAEALALRLIAGVDGFAQSGARDDMCLLVAVVQ